MTRLASRQRGMTLAELMVSLTIGLFVTMGAAALLVAANAGYLSQVDAAGVDDGGRYALELIGRAARQAAYVDWERVDLAAGIDPAGPPQLAGLDDHVVSKTSYGIAGAVAGAVNGSDVLAVRYAGAGPAPDGDGSVLNCAGFPVNELEEGWSIFYVARNTEGEAELRCKYRGSTSWGADAIVSGVDSFQVLYGLDTDTPLDGVANQYVSASELDALDAALVLNGADAAERERDRLRRTWWKRLTVLKVALVLHGARPTRAEREPAVYDLFGEAYAATYGDLDRGTRVRESALPASLRGRERRLFAATIALRNQGR